jgi:hypothetical protein
MLEKNGLPRIRAELKALLYGAEPLDLRYNRFRSTIKGLGPSSITEIMCFIAPQKYGIWNDKPKNVLPLLDLQDALPNRVFESSIKGSDYVLCIEVLKERFMTS